MSGGGFLGMYLENFFEIIGIDLLVGYGLIEIFLVLIVRYYWENLWGFFGRFFFGIEIKIVNLEIYEILGFGEKGLVLV